MQKDMHFYMTYAVARRVGVDRVEALKIAWADQYTDDLTRAAVHGIQTQAKADLSGNWDDHQVQLTVLVPFHFIPGGKQPEPWVTTPNCDLASRLMEVAGTSADSIRIGIALHALQDTFSHAGFSGWRDDVNSCFPWYAPVSALPNIGHAEMQATPDVVNYIWTDPRNGEVIDNKKRAMTCARATFNWIRKSLNPEADEELWDELRQELEPLFEDRIYDRRKEGFRALVGAPELRYSLLTTQFEPVYKRDFVKAAAEHLGLVMSELGQIEGLTLPE